MTSTIVALHGFLGKPSDWNSVAIKTQKVDLFSYPHESFSVWTKHFNKAFQNQNLVLMGYSLGGRLALHALLDNPSQWAAGIIISAHPGLVKKEEKEKRIHEDANWAERFLNEKWSTLMQDWNGRPVFEGRNAIFDRQEKDYDRTALASLLVHTSRGRQRDLRGEIAQLEKPILWIIGAQDLQYVEVSKTIRFKHPASKIVVIEGAGHRVTWEQPARFIEEVNHFLHDIK